MKAFPGSRWWQKPFPGCVVDRDGDVPPPSVLFLLNENGGLTAYDIAGGNTGTLDATTMWNPGKFGSCIDTAVGTKKINVASPNANLNKMAVNQTATWVWWAKRGSTGQGGMLYKSDGNVSKGWYAYIDAGNTYRFIIVGTGNLNAAASTTPATGVWAHYAASLNGPFTTASSMKIYVNGLASTSTPTAGSGTTGDDSAQALTIGAGGTGANGNFDGQIDHCAFWNGVALTAAQIQRLYWDPFAYILKPGARRIYTPGITGSPVGHSFPLLHCGA
jgi:hypothetical protein